MANLIKSTDAKLTDEPNPLSDSTATEYYNADGVARRYRMAARTVYRHADQGLMPYGVKLGALRRWSLQELLAWEAAGCQPVRAVKGGGVHRG